MSKNVWILMGMLVLVFCYGGKIWAAPITFNTALPVSQEQWILRQQFIYGEGSGSGQHVQEAKSVTVLGYGVTPNLSLFGIVPWAYRDFNSAVGIGRNAKGLGDMQLIARYTVYQHNFRSGTFRVSPFAGVEAPTGRNKIRDTRGQLPPSLQPGSGSWDPLAGVIVSYASIDLNLDAQLYWQGNTKANNIERGDIFSADLSLQPRLYPQKISADTKGFLFGALELNLRHQDKNDVGGFSDPNTGGTRLFITPGLHYAAKRWMAEVAVQIPIVQNVNGINTKQNYVVFTGLRMNF